MRFRIMEAIKKLFANQLSPEPRATATFSAQLAGLDAPGTQTKKSVVALPAPVAPAPAPVVIDQPTAMPAPELCPHCGQPMPKKIPAPIVVCDPNNPNTRPVDWAEEARTDLPMRTPARIQHLLKFETMEQTRARIENDGRRYRHQRALEGLL
jgi:hypothetical protein